MSITAFRILFIRHFLVFLARVIGFQLSNTPSFTLEELLFLNGTLLLANVAACKLLCTHIAGESHRPFLCLILIGERRFVVSFCLCLFFRETVSLEVSPSAGKVIYLLAWSSALDA